MLIAVRTVLWALLLCMIALIASYAEASACCELPKPKPKTVYITKTVEAKATPATATASASASNVASTGNQVVTVTQPPIAVVKLRRTIIKHRTKTVQRPVLVYRPNRLLLLGGATKTNLDINYDCCNLQVNRTYGPDVGLQYIRDFGTLSATVAATMNGSAYLGLGINW